MVIAAVYAAAFLIVGAFVPTYSSTSSSETSTGVVTHSSSSATMVAVNNGVRVLVVLALPLVAVGLVWVSIMWQRRYGHLDAGVMGWIVVVLLGVMTFFAMLSIGIFIVPLVVLLAAACANAPTTAPKAAL